MRVKQTAILGKRDAEKEQGSCGIRRRLLNGGAERHFAVSQVDICDARAHYHNETWELYVIQKGKGVLVLDGEEMHVKEGDVVEIPPGVVHRAIPDPEMKVVVVMSPFNAEKHDMEYVDNE
jgi:mannose-6-phosphate isomerase-like protein (cupin superfamily)